jgi:hypothetical protein
MCRARPVLPHLDVFSKEYEHISLAQKSKTEIVRRAVSAAQGPSADRHCHKARLSIALKELNPKMKIILGSFRAKSSFVRTA